MQEDYKPQEIEPKVQKEWDELNINKAKIDKDKEKFYCLSMFPYPSGKLHMGHVRTYTIGDVIARFQRLKGKNVLHPIGWDAFGLPAENAAFENKTSPRDWTLKNIDQMRSQLKQLGFSYDWDREIATCSEDYYVWEQWFFIQLYKDGLVYKKKSLVNWDPVDKTVLANEQVIDGKGWRSGATVETKEISQWFLRITDFADELLEDLELLKDHWPDNVITMQKNWIGKSEGTIVNFDSDIGNLEIFTTRVDTLFGVTFLAASMNHESIKQCDANIIKFCETNKNISQAGDDQKSLLGIFSGKYATHPFTKQKIPIWFANYIVDDYGTGVVMCVPAHDTRDFSFAKKYDLEIKEVIKGKSDTLPFISHGTLCSSGDYDGLESKEAMKLINKYLISNNLGSVETKFRLRDWGISRQRYWGCPIPMIYRDDGEVMPVDESELPIKLPNDIDFTVAGNPLDHHESWKYTKCKLTGKDAIRETDTLDTFFESSWYQARFACPTENTSMLNNDANYWLPVDQYVGGIEHAVLHLLYARFFHKLLRKKNILKDKEPFKSLITQGMVLKDGSKMSKSKGNTIDPQDLVEKYGADTVRLFIIFASPIENSLDWSDKGVEGSYRFLKRFWNLAKEVKSYSSKEDSEEYSKDEINFLSSINLTIKKVSNDIENRYSLNTIVSSCMESTNLFIKEIKNKRIRSKIINDYFMKLIIILSPITPHICYEIWNQFDKKDNIFKQKWPVPDKNYLEIDDVVFIVQINGKLRKRFELNRNLKENDIENIVLNDDDIKKYTDNKEIVKVIHVKGKLVNIVIK
ncbi:MAG: leucine--tRNA ligase [Pseudomonadota bacterium]|nr:leucine--tRNA ligase [Pseudomonadota bacterium]